MKRRARSDASTRRSAMSLTVILVVLFMATIGLDRVDLLAGSGSFTLTPAVLLSPALVAAASSLTLSGRAVALGQTRASTVGLTILLILLLGLLLSAPTSSSDRTIPRLAQLATITMGAWATISIVRRLALFRAVEVGALLGLGVYGALNLVQTAVYARYGLVGPDFLNILNVSINPYGPDFIRLSGGSLDPNRAAYTIATYAYLLLGDPLARRRTLRWSVTILVICTALTVATLSRSGMVAFAITVGAICYGVWRKLSTAQRTVGLASIAGALGIAVSLLGEHLWAALAPALDRFDRLEDGSSTAHFRLIEQGLDDFASGSFFSTIFGRGYGSSYLYLQGFFPDNPYGNYHSVWITMLVEGGLIGLTTIALLLFVPLAGPRRWLALAAIWFGVFYQSQTDPTFWTQVAVLWALPSTRSIAGELKPESLHEPVAPGSTPAATGMVWPVNDEHSA